MMNTKWRLDLISCINVLNQIGQVYQILSILTLNKPELTKDNRLEMVRVRAFVYSSRQIHNRLFGS